MLANPFIVYVASFAGVIAAYQLGWSEAYPDLSPALLAFFATTFAAAALLAWLTVGDTRSAARYEPGRLPSFVVWPLIASFAADIVYTGYVPLFSSFTRGFVFSGEIGVPSLHVFNGTFGATFSAIRFCDFLQRRRARDLAEAIVPIVFLLLILYRGPVLMLLVTWFFAWLIKGGLNIRRAIAIAAIACAVLFAFGKIGDLREGSSDAIVKIGRPSAAFTRTGIPPAYLWTFIYMTSPIANLQLAANERSLDEHGVVEFVVSEMVPDVISKRILPRLHADHLAAEERVKTPEVSKGLNVASLYGRAMVLGGWWGAAAMFGQLCALILIYLRLIRHSPFRMPSLALLNCLIVFCTFQNMIAFSGVLLQIVWPLLLTALLARSGRQGQARA
jgi:hypothetical protein